MSRPVPPGEGPLARMNLKNVPDTDSSIYVEEDREQVQERISAAMPNGFITVHRLRDGRWHEMTVSVRDIVTVESQ